jgi:hypothetical protein
VYPPSSPSLNGKSSRYPAPRKNCHLDPKSSVRYQTRPKIRPRSRCGHEYSILPCTARWSPCMPLGSTLYSVDRRGDNAPLNNNVRRQVDLTRRLGRYGIRSNGPYQRAVATQTPHNEPGDSEDSKGAREQSGRRGIPGRRKRRGSCKRCTLRCILS